VGKEKQNQKRQSHGIGLGALATASGQRGGRVAMEVGRLVCVGVLGGERTAWTLASTWLLFPRPGPTTSALIRGRQPWTLFTMLCFSAADSSTALILSAEYTGRTANSGV